MLKMIVAYDEARGIGKAGVLPWRLPDDMRHFRKRTMGQALIMGRRTYDSMGGPLPGRMNLVLSRHCEGPLPMGRLCWMVPSLGVALGLIENTVPKVAPWVIGGGEVYRLALESGLVECVVASEVHGNWGCDVTFPKLQGEWNRRVVASYTQFDVVSYEYTGATASP